MVSTRRRRADLHVLPAAVQDPHGVLVPDVADTGASAGRPARHARQQLTVAGGGGAATGHGLLEVGQLDPQDRGLQRVQPGVPAQRLVVVLPAAPWPAASGSARPRRHRRWPAARHRKRAQGLEGKKENAPACPTVRAAAGPLAAHGLGHISSTASRAARPVPSTGPCRRHGRTGAPQEGPGS